ncbi:MAG: hypothetical protein ABUK11_02050 [Mariprofundaceae bacterium]
MEIWLEAVIRQLILYSLPLLISLTFVSFIESKLTHQETAHPFFAISWMGTWLPLLAAILFSRAVIFSLPQPVASGSRAALYRCLGHIILCSTGFLLYSWSLNHQPSTGLPPLHLWWGKVLMFFNLCMACLHLVPLPGMLMGELILPRQWLSILTQNNSRHTITLFTLLAASPLTDWLLGSPVIFPIYEQLANLAETLI